MKILKNEEGISLLEMIVVISLIMVAIGIVALSVNNVNYANLQGSAERYQSDLRMLREKSMYSLDKTYVIEWLHDGTNAYYEISYSTDGTNYIVTETVTINADITVTKDGTNVKDFTGTDGYIIFDSSDGSATFGEGEYIFSSAVLGQDITVQLIEFTGRVFIDE